MEFNYILISTLSSLGEKKRHIQAKGAASRGGWIIVERH